MKEYMSNIIIRSGFQINDHTKKAIYCNKNSIEIIGDYRVLHKINVREFKPISEQHFSRYCPIF